MNSALRRVQPTVGADGSSSVMVSTVIRIVDLEMVGGVTAFDCGEAVQVDRHDFALVAGLRSTHRAPEGVVTTIVGSSGRGAADGLHGVAEFAMLHSMVLDEAAGLLYVCDANRVQSVRLADGMMSTLAGRRGGYCEGAALSQARFHGLSDIMLLDDGWTLLLSTKTTTDCASYRW